MLDYQLPSTILGLPASLVGFIAVMLGNAIEGYFLMRYQGGLRRGVKIWQESLPLEMEEALRNLTYDIVKLEKENDLQGFIKTNGKAVLVRSRRKDLRTSWPHVAYINLEDAYPLIEFRTAWSAALWPFLVLLYAPSCTGGMFTFWIVCLIAISHWSEKRAIYAFIQRYLPKAST